MTTRRDKVTIVGDSAAADTDGLGDDVTGASFTLTASNAGDSLAHLITITNNTANSHAGKTITIVGTGPNGQAQTESVTGPGASATVTSTKYFLTVTSVTPSATIGADTFDIGWSADSVSPWEPLDRLMIRMNFGCTVASGSPTYTVQHTFDGVAVFKHSFVIDETTNQDGSYTGPIQAIRLNWTAAGEVNFTGILQTAKVE